MAMGWSSEQWIPISVRTSWPAKTVDQHLWTRLRESFRCTDFPDPGDDGNDAEGSGTPGKDFADSAVTLDHDGEARVDVAEAF